MNRYSLANEIQEMAADVPVGQRSRHVCPSCKGGSSGEESLSIYRRSETEAYFTCFRGKCDLGSGHVALYRDGSGGLLRAKHSDKSPQGNAPDLFPLSKKAYRLLTKKYGLTDRAITYANIRCTIDGRLAMPIWNARRNRRGISVRKERSTFEGRREFGTIPKSLIYKEGRNNVTSSWYFGRYNKTKHTKSLVLVEDQLSAIRVARYVDCLALLGTNVTRPMQTEINSMGYEKVYIALDEDATDKAFRLRKQLAPVLHAEVEIIPLSKDFKNMKENELRDVLRPRELYHDEETVLDIAELYGEELTQDQAAAVYGGIRRRLIDRERLVLDFSGCTGVITIRYITACICRTLDKVPYKELVGTLVKFRGLTAEQLEVAETALKLAADCYQNTDLMEVIDVLSSQ